VRMRAAVRAAMDVARAGCCASQGVPPPLVRESARVHALALPHWHGSGRVTHSPARSSIIVAPSRARN
jgi:hypothetical protein